MSTYYGLDIDLAIWQNYSCFFGEDRRISKM